MAMRHLLFTTAILLAGCDPGLAPGFTMGSTAMGLPSTPGTIVTSPLNGPSPFSATTQPNSPGTTLAPVPLASDPTTPGTVVTCATPTGQIAPGTPAVPVISMSATGGGIVTTPFTSVTSSAPTIPTVPATSPASTTASSTAPALLSATPATSFLTDFPGSTVPVASSPLAGAATATSAPTASTVPTKGSTSVAGRPTTRLSARPLRR